jgi:hypothetical protein
MTDAPTQDQEAPARDTLWVTDAELIRRSGVPVRGQLNKINSIVKY